MSTERAKSAHKLAVCARVAQRSVARVLFCAAVRRRLSRFVSSRRSLLNCDDERLLACLALALALRENVCFVLCWCKPAWLGLVLAYVCVCFARLKAAASKQRARASLHSTTGLTVSFLSFSFQFWFAQTQLKLKTCRRLLNFTSLASSALATHKQQQYTSVENVVKSFGKLFECLRAASVHLSFERNLAGEKSVNLLVCVCEFFKLKFCELKSCKQKRVKEKES